MSRYYEVIMLFQKFFKLTTLLSTFVFLSGIIAMEPQKRSMNDIYAEIGTNIKLYSDMYRSDLSELIPAISSNKFTNAVAILEAMADNTPNYTQEDKNNLLSLVQSYATELYTNELIGLNPFGTLTKHKEILCYINAQCTPTPNLNDALDTPDTEQPEVSKKSRRTIKKNAPVVKIQTVEIVDNFALDIQTNIDTITQARKVAPLHQNDTSIGDKATINKAIRQWFSEFIIILKKALANKDENLLNRLWHANFNNDCLQFKARESALKDLIITTLQKDNIDEASITWLTSRITKLVYKKETKLTLKSKAVQQVAKPVIKPVSEKPKVNALSKRINTILTELNNTTDHNNVMEILEQFSAIFNLSSKYRSTLEEKDIPTLTAEDLATLTTDDINTIKFNIDETIGRIYQNCLLGLYDNGEQKLQLHIFDTCAEALIDFNTQLRKQRKESDKDIDTYFNNANKRKQDSLYGIKVIRDTEKIASAQEVKEWKMVIQDRLSSQLEGQNALAIKKTIQANFDASKNPLLAEQYENIVPVIYNQKNTGATWPVWLTKNKQIFEQPKIAQKNGQPIPSNGIFQTCNDHWMLGSLALAAIVTGIYYVLEQCYAEDEDEDELSEKEELQEETAEESAATQQKNKKDAQAKTA